MWYFITVILAFKRLRQKDGKFQATLGYITRYYVKHNNNIARR